MQTYTYKLNIYPSDPVNRDKMSVSKFTRQTCSLPKHTIIWIPVIALLMLSNIGERAKIIFVAATDRRQKDFVSDELYI